MINSYINIGGKFLLAIPPAVLPLVGSLELDPEVIQKPVPLTPHQQTHLGCPAVASIKQIPCPPPDVAASRRPSPFRTEPCRIAVGSKGTFLHHTSFIKPPSPTPPPPVLPPSPRLGACPLPLPLGGFTSYPSPGVEPRHHRPRWSLMQYRRSNMVAGPRCSAQAPLSQCGPGSHTRYRS